jgi:putative redox protein
MSVVIEGVYLGNKKARLRHEPSGAEFLTDVPRDAGGEASSFSPTDLVAGALGACMISVMGVVAERAGIDLGGTRMRVEKEMTSAPRRVGRLTVTLRLPARLKAEERERLERVARQCPVLRSLHPEVTVDAQFLYDV